MNGKRLIIGIVMGIILGIFCIIGVSQRIPPSIQNPTIYLIGAWYNRVIMGIIIGFAGEIIILKKSLWLNAIIRGAIIGVLVSLSFYE